MDMVKNEEAIRIKEVKKEEMQAIEEIEVKKVELPTDFLRSSSDRVPD